MKNKHIFLSLITCNLFIVITLSNNSLIVYRDNNSKSIDRIINVIVILINVVFLMI